MGFSVSSASGSTWKTTFLVVQLRSWPWILSKHQVAAYFKHVTNYISRTWAMAWHIRIASLALLLEICAQKHKTEIKIFQGRMPYTRSLWPTGTPRSPNLDCQSRQKHHIRNPSMQKCWLRQPILLTLTRFPMPLTNTSQLLGPDQPAKYL